jgi:predicted dehydrogenase
MEKIKWGIISTSDLAVKKVIPAMQQSRNGEVAAIASRSQEAATHVAATLGIPHAYGSYEALLADPAITAIYNPLPNHLHVEWTIKALEAGKHVLCEKPLSMNVQEAEHLAEVAATYPQLKVMEAFMYRFHPQWQFTQRTVQSGAIGQVRAMNIAFSYFNDDAANIRNQPAVGGGALLDIGCYATSTARFIFDAEPTRVVGTIERDPTMGTDRLDSGILDFGSGIATFTLSTQLVPFQRVSIFGTRGAIEIIIPFNAPPDQPCRVLATYDGETREELTPAVDQYTLQAEAFADAISNETAVPTPLSDAVANMRVLDALVQSASQSTWVALS